MHHIMFGNILLLQTMLMLRKAGPRMLSVRFVTNVSVDQGCSTSRVAAHILGRLVLGHIKTGIHPCIVINKMMTGMVHSKIILCMVLATVLIPNFILMTTQHVLRLCKTSKSPLLYV